MPGCERRCSALPVLTYQFRLIARSGGLKWAKFNRRGGVLLAAYLIWTDGKKQPIK
ncbi:hypothetical protein L288_05885 [Sphingobium quisquiliarum P25]|uniref:Uncharacterized protein n=1 Tax=Sphingobium quisquiliarum P25 TaxID=1329909 RepID=T0HBB5_9SPHN|nr:hypothetical protein L288_05885 [Sphingobium quisquiliarum P25]